MLKNNSGLSNSDLNVLYIQAKIQMRPMDYTMRDRLITLPASAYADITSTFKQNGDFEFKLAQALGATCSVTSELKDVLLKEVSGTKGCYSLKTLTDDSTWELQQLRERNLYGMFYKHNDFLMNAHPKIDPELKHSSKSLLLALMKMYVELMAKDSIVPQLMLSRFKVTEGKPLDYVANIEFVREALNNHNHWNFQPLYDTDYTDGACFIQAPTLVEMSLPLLNGSTPAPTADIEDAMAELHRQSVILGCLYLCEAIRTFNKLSDADRRELGPLLFRTKSASYKNIQDVFGNYDDSELKFVPQQELEDILSKPNETRYGLVIDYVDNRLHSEFPEVFSWTGADIAKQCSSNAFPIVFSRMCNDLTFKAWEDFRVKNFALMLSMCKEQGIDISSLSIPQSAEQGSAFGGLDMSDEAPSQAFGDMQKGTAYDKDAETSENEPQKKQKKPIRAPQLSSMSDLLKSCDSKYSIHVTRVLNDPGLKQAYLKLLTLIDLITKQLTKQIREIKTYNFGGKNSGKTRGKLDSHTMHRYKTDPRIFYDNTYKTKEMDLAFGIVLDQSGSMWGDGVRNGSIALIMLHHVLNALRVNHAIIGHNSRNWNDVNIMKYVCFNEDPQHTLETPYMLANLKTNGGNCDSGALNYMEQYIKRVPNKDKIVLIFNDGEPSECEESDLKNQVRKMEQEGIHVIGLGIDFENIKLYYPDNANGRNMKEMTSILVSILKRYVLEKKV